MKARAANRGGRGIQRRWGLCCLVCALALLAWHAQAADVASGVSSADASIADTSTVAVRSEYSATLKEGVPVAVENPYGDVSARFGGFEHKVQVYAVLQEPAGAAHIELEPGTGGNGDYRISPHLPAGVTVAAGQRVDLEVFVPEGHALSVRTEQGSIEVKSVHGDVHLASTTGDISLRGIKGVIQAETGDGQIDASLSTAPRKSSQRLTTRTGDINLAVDDRLDAELDMATSALFATEYSLKVTRQPGQEPNKRARTVIGDDAAKLFVESRRGQIRVSRRVSFTPAGGASSAAADEQEEGQEDNDSD